MQCVFCSKTADSGVSLSNGRQIHSSCLNELVQNYSDVQSRVEENSVVLANHLAKAKNTNGLVKAVLEIFLIKEDSSDYESERLRLERELDIAERDHEKMIAIAAPVFDYIIGYPADWNTRKEKVKFRDRSCQDCGSMSGLHVHHKMPLSRGGSNKLDNLILLCESCHRRKHGERSFSYADDERDLSFKSRIELISSAIKNKRDITFVYTKFSENKKTTRKITPEKLFEMENDKGTGTTLCVEGYCHLRRATRFFAIKRMRQVSLN